MAILKVGKAGWGHPYTTITAAIAAANPSDEIWWEAYEPNQVTQAVYSEPGMGIFDAGLKVRGMSRGICWGSLVDQGHVPYHLGSMPVKPKHVVTQGEGATVQARNVTIENVESCNGNDWGLTTRPVTLAGDVGRIRWCHVHDFAGNGLSIAHGNQGDFFVEHNDVHDNAKFSDQHHNAYLTTTGTLWIIGNRSRRVVGEGHLWKTRAATVYLLHNELTGSIESVQADQHSQVFDMAWGGKLFAVGNVFTKGVGSLGSYMIKAGAERKHEPPFTSQDALESPEHQHLIPLYTPQYYAFVGNTFVTRNTLSGGATWNRCHRMDVLRATYGPDDFLFRNNLLVGPVNTQWGAHVQAVGAPIQGLAFTDEISAFTSKDLSGNLYVAQENALAFRDMTLGDYRLTAGSAQAIGQAVEVPTDWHGVNLEALMAYEPGRRAGRNYRPVGA